MKKILILFCLFFTVSVMQAHNKTEPPKCGGPDVEKTVFCGENINAADIYLDTAADVLKTDFVYLDNTPGITLKKTDHKLKCTAPNVLSLKNKNYRARARHINNYNYDQNLVLYKTLSTLKPPLYS